jgi:DNA-binding response OmpR family regulator
MSSPKPRILCVEDNEDVSVLLDMLLTHDGYEVESARNLADTLKLANSSAFDLYLLDHRLPDGTGAELCRRLREIAPQTPVVFFSGSALPAERQRGLDAGARAYLVKPDDLNKLVATVGEFICATVKH